MSLTYGETIRKGVGFALGLTAMSSPAWAFLRVPEIDPGLATSAVALLAGGLLMIASRGRRK